MNEIWAIVLAAGESSRMKSPKMVLPFGNSTMIETVIANVAASDADKMVVILGSWKKEILQVIDKHRVNHCFNDNYKQGMLSSVQCGLRFISGASRGALICPGDQPMVDKAVINMVISAFKNSGKGIVIPVCGRKRGHPVMIDIKYFNEILNLKPADTLKKVMVNHPDDIEEVETDHSSVLEDIDTPEDYTNALKLIS
ncbi:MAG: nucleotidyltransferase family protein [Bacteroidales bacterium]